MQYILGMFVFIDNEGTDKCLDNFLHKIEKNY